MCGRAILVTGVDEIAEIFGVEPIPIGPPRFNIPPSQPALVVRASATSPKGRELALVKWGLVPFWAEDPKAGAKLAQARAETVESTPAYREAFKSRRCLFVVDGFYEWSTEDRPEGRKKKVRKPHHVRRKDARPFAIAAVWDRWRSKAGGETIESCAVVTTAAAGPILALHDRMPLVLGPAEQARWLGPETGDAHELIVNARSIAAAAVAELVVAPVSTWVNDVKHDDPRCVEPPSAEAANDRPGQIALRFD